MTIVANDCAFDFTGARALVTGGTSGIGYAIASGLADAGAAVTVTGTRSDASQYDDVELARFAFVQLNTCDAVAVDELAARFDVLDILVNNAGGPYPDGDEWSPDGFASSLDANLKGAMRLTVGCRLALAASSMAGGASVINVVSMSAFRGVPTVPGYGASKAALISLTQDFALRWMPDGIRVNAIAPGLIYTRMTAPLEGLPEIRDRELARVPAGRMGTAEECAAAALFLCTKASAYTTGISLAVDGGYLAF